MSTDQLHELNVIHKIPGTRSPLEFRGCYLAVKFSTYPKRPDRLWGPPSFLFRGYQG